VSFLKVSFYGVSLLTLTVIFICGVIIRQVISLDGMEIPAKTLSVSLLLLVSFMIYSSDLEEKQVKESLKNERKK
jgi:hypothetical protein